MEDNFHLKTLYIAGVPGWKGHIHFCHIKEALCPYPMICDFSHSIYVMKFGFTSENTRCWKRAHKPFPILVGPTSWNRTHGVWYSKRYLLEKVDGYPPFTRTQKPRVNSVVQTHDTFRDQAPAVRLWIFPEAVILKVNLPISPSKPWLKQTTLTDI